MIVANHGLDDGKAECFDVGLCRAIDGCDDFRLAIQTHMFLQVIGKAFVVDLMPFVAVAPFASGLAAIHERPAWWQLRACATIIYIRYAELREHEAEVVAVENLRVAWSVFDVNRKGRMAENVDKRQGIRLRGVRPFRKTMARAEFLQFR